MADRALEDVVRGPGRLYLNGVELGLVRGIYLDLVQTQFRLHLEEYDETGDHILGGQRWRVFTTIRQWTDDGIAAVFPNTAGASGSKGVVYPGLVRAGRLASAHAGAGTLEYRPNDPTLYPRLLLHRALPLFDESFRLHFSALREFGFPVVWEGIRDPAGLGYDVTFARDLLLRLLVEDDMGLGRSITGGSTDQSTVIRIVDSTDGTPEESVDEDTSGLALWYRREAAAKTSITAAALAALTTAHADGGIEHIDDGYYRLDLPDAAVAAGVAGVQVGGTVTGMVVVGVYHPIS